MRSEEYLTKIRESAGLKRAVLKKITVERNTVTFSLVTDLNYGKEDIAYAERVSGEFVSPPLTARAEIVKSIPEAKGVRATILEIFKEKYPSAAAFLMPEDVEAFTEESGGRFLLHIGKEEKERFTQGEVLDGITLELCRRFCGAWSGDIVLKALLEEEIEHRQVAAAEKIVAPRMFEIQEYVAIDDAKPKMAIYCSDLEGENLSVTVCGVITYIEERRTKKDKPFFRISLRDASGSVQANYFTRQKTLEKIRSLKLGDQICMTGDQTLFNGNYSFTAKNIDFGRPPENFVLEEREGKAAPAEYSKVFPEPLEDLEQANLFDDTGMPEVFRKSSYVVFDLETTGLSNMGQTMDRIIEIGAVKITEGKVSEKFSTFVACPVKLSEEIKNLTGIDDEMLVGAPDIKDAIADFFKFCDGCTLVGHNVGFDYKFIRYYGEREGYLFDRKNYDTLSFSQELLRLNNYKLNTVAAHFGFEFHHHRAFDDAFVTAKIFMRLVKEKGGLPSF